MNTVVLAEKQCTKCDAVKPLSEHDAEYRHLLAIARREVGL